jgi:hypothetical protein
MNDEVIDHGMIDHLARRCGLRRWWEETPDSWYIEQSNGIWGPMPADVLLTYLLDLWTDNREELKLWSMSREP